MRTGMFSLCSSSQITETVDKQIQNPKHSSNGRFLAVFFTFSIICCNQALGVELILSAWNPYRVESFDLSTGISNGVFGDASYADGLTQPDGMTLGPDAHLYVSSRSKDSIFRYDGSTGAFKDVFVSSGSIDSPTGITFGPDGNLYVLNEKQNNVSRYNGQTGQFMDVFASDGGLVRPIDIIFGPDKDLYVTSFSSDSVLRYDGDSGAFLGTFISSVDLNPWGMDYGPDGNFYVGSFGSNSIRRYDAISGSFLNTFASGGGLDGPEGFAFGPDGYLYVSSWYSGEIIRYDGFTGEFIDVFATTTSYGPRAILITPEPCSLVLLSLGGLMLRRKR